MVSRGGVCLSVSKFGTFSAQKLIPSCAFLGRTCGKKNYIKIPTIRLSTEISVSLISGAGNCSGGEKVFEKAFEKAGESKS